VSSHQAIAGEVRAELARQKLSGVRVAKQLGWTQNYISRRLSGTVPFDVADLQAIADYLEVPVTNFFQLRAEGSRSAYIDQVSPAEALGAAA
jgi:transcriptional regulator with XRE-family HTH domain